MRLRGKRDREGAGERERETTGYDPLPAAQQVVAGEGLTDLVWESRCHSRPVEGVSQKSIFNRPCQFLAINAHKMAPVTTLECPHEGPSVGGDVGLRSTSRVLQVHRQCNRGEHGAVWQGHFLEGHSPLPHPKLLLLYSRYRSYKVSLSLKLSDTRVYEPQIRARLVTTTPSSQSHIT